MIDLQQLHAFYEKKLTDEGLPVLGWMWTTMYNEAWGAQESIWDRMLHDPTPEQLAQARELLGRTLARLPVGPRHLLELRSRGLHQRAIADLLGVSQAAVSVQISKAIQCLRAIVALGPPLTEEELHEYEPDAVRRELVRAYLETWCQSEAGRRHGMGQGRLRFLVVTPALRSTHRVAQMIQLVVRFQYHDAYQLEGSYQRGRSPRRGGQRIAPLPG